METSRVVFLCILFGLGGACTGWSLHAAMLRRRLVVRPIRQWWPNGRIVGWVVNFGRPIVGQFRDRNQALRHRQRLVNTLTGHADEGGPQWSVESASKAPSQPSESEPSSN